jgi:nucleotide-binding universal stress UspA family protein
MLNKKILVPIDFSECSINALKYATELAKLMKAEITILHAFNIPVTHGEIGATSIVNSLASGIEEDIKDNFNELSIKVPTLSEVQYETVVKHSFVLDAVYNYCNANKIDLIVMGTSGASGLDEVLVGSNTYSIIKEINCAVIAIPINASFESVNKIALASDYRDFDEKVLEPLKFISRLFAAEIHVLHISEAFKLDDEEAEIAKKLERYLKGVDHHYNLVVNDDFEDGLETYITDKEIDMVAIIPRKRNLFERIFGKSASKKIIFHAHIPLLALPSR